MQHRPAGAFEKSAGILISVVLAGIAAGVYFKQFRYDPSRFASEVSLPAISSATSASNPETAFFEKIPAGGFKPMAKPESYDADTLYIKINGKAELYIESGFKKLDSQLYCKISDSNSWIEFYAYDMGTPLNAFAVYSQQKRSEGQEAGITELAYRTPDAVFLCCGKFYCEVTGSAASEEMVKAMLETAEKFVKARGKEAGRLEQLDVFPKEDLVAGSIKYYIADAYGFEGFKNTFSAAYNVNDMRVVAFICKAPDEDSARQTANEYLKSLKENLMGREKEPINAELAGAVMDMDGIYEIAAARGQYVFGIHEVEDQKAGEEIGSLESE